MPGCCCPPFDDLCVGPQAYASRIHLAGRSEHFRAMLFGSMREAFLPCTAAKRRGGKSSGGGSGTDSGGGEANGGGGGGGSAGSWSDNDGGGEGGGEFDDCIVVEDVTYDVFVKMLEFLYTDEGEKRELWHGLDLLHGRVSPLPFYVCVYATSSRDHHCHLIFLLYIF